MQNVIFKKVFDQCGLILENIVIFGMKFYGIPKSVIELWNLWTKPAKKQVSSYTQIMWVLKGKTKPLPNSASYFSSLPLFLLFLSSFLFFSPRRLSWVAAWWTCIETINSTSYLVALWAGGLAGLAGWPLVPSGISQPAGGGTVGWGTHYHIGALARNALSWAPQD